MFFPDDAVRVAALSEYVDRQATSETLIYISMIKLMLGRLA